MNINKNFLIHVKDIKEWDKVLLILSTYGFSINLFFEELDNNYYYIISNGNHKKKLSAGSLKDVFESYIEMDYQNILVEDIYKL